MEAYEYLSQVYDELMYDTDYEKWAAFLDGMLKERDARRVYEAACGTGQITRRLYKAGYDITAADISPEMLKVAAKKARDEGAGIKFVMQDMRDIEVGNKVDAVISACDGVNYLDGAGAERFLTSAYAALCDSGVLLFDISSSQKLKGLDGEVYFDDREDASCIWQNTYDNKKSALVMDVTLFVRRGRLFERFTETHVQYAHDEEFIIRAAKSAGFKSAEAVECFTGLPLRGGEQRIQFICTR